MSAITVRDTTDYRPGDEVIIPCRVDGATIERRFVVRSTTETTIRFYSHRWTGRLAARLHLLWIWLRDAPARLKWWALERWYGE